MKPRNFGAKALRTPKYRMRVVPLKTRYKRKPKFSRRFYEELI